MPNKRRHAQAFPLTATLIGVAIAVCLAVFAIKALTVKYQVIQGGEKLKRLERELEEYTVKNEALQTQKHKMIAPQELAKFQANGALKLVKIEEKNLVHVGQPQAPQQPGIAKVSTTEGKR
jgi:cell division protein FtsL